MAARLRAYIQTMRAGRAFFVGTGITCLLLLPAHLRAQRTHVPCEGVADAQEDSYPPIILHDLRFEGKLTIPAEMIALLIDGSSGRTIKSCFGQSQVPHASLLRSVVF